MAERIVGQGSFGVVFQVRLHITVRKLSSMIALFYFVMTVKPSWLILLIYFNGNVQARCLETGETVAIKKVLQDKRYKNRELQTMRLLDHPNVISLKHCFFSTTGKDELYLNLVLEYVPETVHRVIRHYNKINQRMPLIYVKLYMYQVRRIIIWQPCFKLSWQIFVLIIVGVIQICRALAYLHGTIGVCHRDIKPQNLLVMIVSSISFYMFGLLVSTNCLIVQICIY